MALVGKRAADLRDIMIEGESGILAVSPPWNRPHYEPSKRRLTWPNGAIATGYSDEEPDELRGPQHSDAWIDELAKFPNGDETMANLELGLRLGSDPRKLISTTPKPTRLYKQIRKDPSTVITRGSTYDNAANLAPQFIDRVTQLFEGTRKGREELSGELLEDVEGALWSVDNLEAGRLAKVPSGVRLVRCAVAVDPATTSDRESAETGIMVGAKGSDGHGYLFGDHSLKASPGEWASKVIHVFKANKADRVVAEVNNGGDMVEAVLRAAAGRRGDRIPYRKVHASRGKQTRAEPVALLYEQHKIHHVGDYRQYQLLEEQLTQWVPDSGMPSPDRLDALVWLWWDLMLGGGTSGAPAAGGKRRVMKPAF
jgi:predicted phage terminase large subunit-like protein